ncbi:hypothetical protein ARNL5_03442 [Anaerolineae bacterium]|nr:hypothetical protein ARNL5_03442 [Anaerolineae bacterium]
MDPHNSYYIYLGVICLAIIGGLYNIKQRDIAMKILVALLCLTLISEFTAYWAAITYRNNMFIYHFFAPIQLVILCVYFDNIGDRHKKRKNGLLIGVTGVVIAVINTLFFQPLQIFNSNFLLFEGIVIMGLALFTFQRILTDDKIDIYRYSHFWIVTILIFFWSITYTTWALFSVLQIKKLFLMSYVSKVLWAVNIITYSAIGFVLLYFSGNRKQLAHE